MSLFLLALAAIPTTTGVSSATKEGRGGRTADANKRRGLECTLTVFSGRPGKAQRKLHGNTVVLHNGKVYASLPGTNKGHKFSGFFVDYPSETPGLGLVSMTSLEPPSMGWIFVDKKTLEVKYGNRSASMDHIKGPWDFTEDEIGVTLESQEKFVAVEEQPGYWAVYMDKDGNCKGLPDRAVPICLERRVKSAANCEVKKPD